VPTHQRRGNVALVESEIIEVLSHLLYENNFSHRNRRENQCRESNLDFVRFAHRYWLLNYVYQHSRAKYKEMMAKVLRLLIDNVLAFVPHNG